MDRNSVSPAPPVIVGYDGSDGAKLALRVAAEEAEAHGVGLTILAVWRPAPVNAAAVAFTTSPDSNFSAELAEAMLSVLEEAKALVHEYAPALPTETLLVEGHAADELIRASRAATMLVVGQRGHGAVAELILGSVSHQCVLHSKCPVLVIPRREKEI
jgi:nucleotide-binding universal stress UspA family protein